MTNKIKLFLSFLISASSLWAQQVPMLGNAHIIEYRKKMASHPIPSAARTQSTSTGFLLPFYDEFSYEGPYPAESNWQNSQTVYVNRTKAIAPPTLGVATFDGLNKYGYPYNDAQTIICGNYGNSIGSFPSDTLTSVDIRLDSASSGYLSPADSVYFSFYYQAEGYYEAPETNDGLILEFYNITDTIPTWNLIWEHSGYTLTDSAWHLVMIPVLDTSYFKKDFKFRFRNLSGACGDVDHWHIDVVKLDRSRNYKDTLFGDFAFSYDLPSPLKNYTQMPYNQYAGASDMKTNVSGIALRNNYDDINYQNVGTDYSFYDNHGVLLDTVYNGNINLGYYGTVGFCNNASIAAPPLNYAYPTMSVPDTFLMNFYLDHSGDAITGNNTISFHQYFSNYYAYDDGSAEAGYGICNDTVVVKYTLKNADVLRAMDIFFDPIYDVKLLESTSFRISVWADNGGVPANYPMYADTLDRYPYFQDSTQRVNGFLRYQFLQPDSLSAGTTFYIGVIPNSYNSLAIGFDKNTNFYQNMFRYTGGTSGPLSGHWYPFPAVLDPDYAGSLMIRPVFGDSSATVSIKDYHTENNALKIYPNPAQNILQITISGSKATQLQITDVLGNVVIQTSIINSQNSETLDVRNLSNGVYFVKALTDKGYTNTQKLLITK